LAAARLHRAAPGDDHVDLFLPVFDVVVLRVLLAAVLDLDHVHPPRRHAEDSPGGTKADAGNGIRTLVIRDVADLFRGDVAHGVVLGGLDRRLARIHVWRCGASTTTRGGWWRSVSGRR